MQRYLRVMKSRHTANECLDTNADCFAVYSIQYTRDSIGMDIWKWKEQKSEKKNYKNKANEKYKAKRERRAELSL